MKPDANQSQIVAALRAAGATVTILAGVGNGVPDLVVGYQDRNLLFEVKNLQGRGNHLTHYEKKWIENWRGQVAIVFGPEDALKVLYGGTE